MRRSDAAGASVGGLRGGGARRLVARFVTAVLVLLLSSLGAGAQASAAGSTSAAASQPSSGGAAPTPSRWVFGRTPAVFRQADQSVATRIGGWIDGSFQDNDRAGEGSTLALNHLDVYLDTRYKQWQLFVEGEYERESNRSGYENERDVEFEQLYVKFTANDLLGVRVGRFNTPFGYWIPVHWSILVDTIEEPIHVGRNLVPEQQVGVEAAGSWFPGELAGRDAEVDYALYVGHGTDSLGEEETDGFAIGTDLRLLLDERYMLGISVYRQRNDEVRNRTEQSYSLYADAKLSDHLTFRSEYLHQSRERTRGALWDRNIDVAYAKLRWDFVHKSYLNYRFSYGDDDLAGRTARTAIQTVTLGVEPYSSVRVKLEYSAHQFRAAHRDDFSFWAFSLGYLF